MRPNVLLIVDSGIPVPAAPAGAKPEVSAEELARIEDQMRTLGYF